MRVQAFQVPPERFVRWFQENVVCDCGKPHCGVPLFKRQLGIAADAGLWGWALDMIVACTASAGDRAGFLSRETGTRNKGWQLLLSRFVDDEGIEAGPNARVDLN